jgi:hypothetical protein
MDLVILTCNWVQCVVKYRGVGFGISLDLHGFELNTTLNSRMWMSDPHVIGLNALLNSRVLGLEASRSMLS